MCTLFEKMIKERAPDPQQTTYDILDYISIFPVRHITTLYDNMQYAHLFDRDSWNRMGELVKDMEYFAIQLKRMGYRDSDMAKALNNDMNRSSEIKKLEKLSKIIPTLHKKLIDKQNELMDWGRKHWAERLLEPLADMGGGWEKTLTGVCSSPAVHI